MEEFNYELLKFACERLELDRAAAGLGKSAFVPPGASDPSAMGGDPSMMGAPPGGAPPMDPMAAAGGAGMPGAPPAAPPPPMAPPAAPPPGAIPSPQGAAGPVDPATGMPKPKRVDPAVLDARMYTTNKCLIAIMNKLGVPLPPELALLMPPDGQAFTQAVSDTQAMEAQAQQTKSETMGTQGGGDPAAGGEAPPDAGMAPPSPIDPSMGAKAAQVMGQPYPVSKTLHQAQQRCEAVAMMINASRQKGRA